jgi:trk system potassium uptake protein TrkH
MSVSLDTSGVRRAPRSYRGVFRPVGVVVLGLGLAILACAGAGIVLDIVQPLDDVRHGGAGALAIAAAVTLALGAGLYAFGRGYHTEQVSRREATLAVAMIWLAVSLCGAIPFMIGANMGFADAFFETVSGLTTTGATVITNIEGTLSRPLLLWRSLIQWLGGMGIVVLFVAVFPNVGVGGKHMFRGEVPGVTAEGLRPRIAETSFTLWKLYAAITALEVLVLTLLGMDPFEAVCHAFTTMATGGFSTRDASIAAFDSAPIEYAMATFMFVASLNYGLFYGVLRTRSLKVVFHNVEFQAFVFLCVLSVVVLTFGILGNHDMNLVEAFRYAYFTVATFVSSTGYVTEDYMAYPPPMIAVLVVIMFIGGCAGSTAGGIKVERIVLLAKQVWAQITRFFRPNVVRAVRMGKKSVPDEILADVSAFFVLYLVVTMASVVLITFIEGTAVPTAFGATLTCISNMGPAPFYVGADNFASYTALSKISFSFTMLLGRLELFTLIALFVPEFWKQ